MVKLKQLKVCFIQPDLSIGGTERFILNTAIALSDLGIEVIFVTNHFDKSHAFAELKSGKYSIRVLGSCIPRSIFGSCLELCAHIRIMYLAIVYYLFVRHVDNPDLYFVDQLAWCVPIFKWTGSKVLYYFHHPDWIPNSAAGDGLITKLYRKPFDCLDLYCNKKSDVILVNDKYTATGFRKYFPETGSQIEIVYPTISRRFHSDITKPMTAPLNLLAPELMHLNELSTNIVFLSIDKYHPIKKLEVAIQAMGLLKMRLSPSEWKHVYLIFAGKYSPRTPLNEWYLKKLMEFAYSESLNKNICFIKSPSDQMKIDLLKACDCLLLTHANKYFGIVTLQAMAASKPIIACNSDGTRETIQHSVTGYLCSSNAASFATYMSNIVNDKELGRVMGREGLQRLEQGFSYDSFSKKINNIVSNLYVTTNS